MSTYTPRHKQYYQENRVKILKGIKEYYLDNKNKLKRNQLKTRYNLELEEFNRILELQNFKCKICDIVFTEQIKPVVDHDHNCCSNRNSCGKCIRGLICHNCNKAIGLLKDDCTIAKKAAEYLKEYSDKHVEG